MDDTILDEIVYDVMNQTTHIDICVLCGVRKKYHGHKLHKFFKLSNNYKCSNCNRYFYEHNHMKKSCYQPGKKYLSSLEKEKNKDDNKPEEKVLYKMLDGTVVFKPNYDKLLNKKDL